MAGGILDPSNLPARPAPGTPKGHDVRALGPSDSSDTGADMAGQGALDDTSDRDGTGERISADEEQLRSDNDIRTDRIVGPTEAGLGSGLDEVEDAWLEKDQGEH
jgi:hypothetical protein